MTKGFGFWSDKNGLIKLKDTSLGIFRLFTYKECLLAEYGAQTFLISAWNHHLLRPLRKNDGMKWTN